MNSAYWMNDPHNINVVHCKICGITIYKVTAGESVGMRRHVMLKHPPDDKKGPPTPDITVTSAITNREPYTTNPKRNSKERQQKVKIHLASFCAIEAILPTFLNTDIFMQFCFVALDDLLPLIPSSEVLVNELANISGKIRENIIHELNETCEFCSLTFQCYTLKCQLTVLQISCRWIDNNLDVRNVVLGCKLYVPVINKTNDLSGLIKDILLPYNTLLPKIISIITQSSEDLTGSISLLFNDKYFSEYVTVVVCFADCLDNELNNLFFNYDTNMEEESKLFLYNLHYIMVTYESNMILGNRWMNEKEKPLLLLGKSQKWTSLYQTLTEIHNNWNEFSDLMKGVISTEIYDSFFCENTLVIIREITATLMPLTEIIETLSVDKTALPLGSIYPYLRTCANLFLYDNGETLPKCVTKLGIELSEKIIRTFAQPWNKTPNKLILGGCSLDPQFKDLSLFEDDEKTLIENYLIEEIKIIEQIHKLDFEELYMNDDENSIEINQPNNNNTNTYKMNYTILEDLEEIRKKREKKGKIRMKPAEEILEEYKDKPVNENDKIYDWWKYHKYEFKELVYLYKKCSCLPATAAPRGELFVPERLPFYIKRDLLDSELAECCIMIRSNMNEIDFLRDSWPSVLLDD